MPHRSVLTVSTPPGPPHLPIELSSISHRGRTFSLAHPVQVTVEIQGGLWVLESKPFRILAYGESRDKALTSFCEDSADLYDHIAKASNENLAADAQELKAKMLGLVTAVHG